MRRATAKPVHGLSAALALASLAALMLLVGCGHAPVRPQAHALPQISREPIASGRRDLGSPSRVDPCAPTRIHRDSDYTPGGLYAPGVSDSGPSAAIDVSALREPVPRREPRARTGNRSPYTVLGKVYRVLDSPAGYHARGIASWYGTKFNGRATSSGELYDICSFTAAHKTLPLPSYVRVSNLDNGRSLVVRVNDRGPFHDGRVMDLSYAAAVRLGVDRTGTAHVQLDAIDPDLVGAASASIPNLDLDPDPRPTLPPPESPHPSFPQPTTPDPQHAQQARAEPPLGDTIIQVASFGDEANASRLVQRLGEAGFAGVGLEPGEADGRTVWRVRIGPIDPDSSDDMLARLRDFNLPDARVLRR